MLSVKELRAIVRHAAYPPVNVEMARELLACRRAMRAALWSLNNSAITEFARILHAADALESALSRPAGRKGDTRKPARGKLAGRRS